MKLTKIYSLATVLILTAVSAFAQGQITYNNVRIDEVKNLSGVTEKYRVSMDVNLSDIDVRNQQMVVLTPQVVSSDKQETLFLPQIIFAGSTRLNVIRRQVLFGHYAPGYDRNSKLYRAKDFKPQGTIAYTTEFPAHAWMKKADFGVAQEVMGCASCIEPSAKGFQSLLPIKKEPYKPAFAVNYVAPEVEAVKNRSESLEAHFNYRVARSELLKDYKNNQAELDRVNSFVSKINADKNLTISDFAIEGFASPEGSSEGNLTLSKNRANTFASYLKSNFNIANNKMKVQGKGEDWDGLRSAVLASNMSNKEAILKAIDNNSDANNRKRALKNLNGGATYRELLETIYPELRRNTLRVSYVVKGFNLEEALQAYRTNPYQLSLEEMFRISQTFTKGSQDFIDVFKTAVKYFPESEIARINVAAAYLEAGKYSEAKDLLLKAGNSSETLNNLAIVSFYEGNYKQARSYFEQAMAKGSKAAPQNLQELAKFEESL